MEHFITKSKLLNNASDETKNSRSMVYQRGSQKEGSPYYVFLYSDDDNSDAEESIPLQGRTKSTSNPRKVEVINVPLKPEDTLQALALRYRCTLSELKRINKIDKENEIFAHRFIKVPVQAYSILTEDLNRSGIANQVEGTNESSPSIVEQNTNSTLPIQPTLNSTESSQTAINAIILNSVLEPLSSYNNSNALEASHSETDQLLDSSERNVEESHIIDKFKCSGDDCGLSWMHLLGFSLLLGFAGPIIYILYIAEHSSKIHAHVH